MPRLIPFQADPDGNMEFATGFAVVDREGVNSTHKLLPRPSTAPYLPDPGGVVGFTEDSAAPGDIDGDGDVDLIRSCLLTYAGGYEFQYRIMACLNDGQGNFSPGWTWSGSSALNSIRGFPVKLADMDGDGDLDLIEAQTVPRIRWNDGTGNFNGTPYTFFGTNDLYAIHDFHASDFNGDGTMDLVVAVEWTASDSLILFSGNGGGTFTKAAQSNPAGGAITQIELMDVNRDGKPDFITSQVDIFSYVVKLAYQLNQGTAFGAPVTLATYPVPTVASRVKTATGDVDEDGQPDLVFSYTGTRLHWRRNTGAASFAPAEVLAAEPGTGETGTAGGMAMVDQDGDGDLDILWKNGLNYLENTSITRRIAPPALTPWSGTSPGPGTVDLTTADLNKDGRVDLVATDPANSRLIWYPGGATTLTGSIPISLTGNQAPTSLAAGDLDGDGDADLAWANGTAVWIAKNTAGTGIGWTQTSILNNGNPSCLAMADVDADGDMDLVTGSRTSGVCRLLMNDGDGASWSAETVSLQAKGVAHLGAAQLRPGQHLEIALISDDLGTASFKSFRRDGAGWVVDQEIFQSGGDGSNMGLALADFKRGGRMEPAFQIGAPANPVLISAPPDVWQIPTTSTNNLMPVDWNGDGAPDLLSATSSGLRIIGRDQNGEMLPTASPTVFPCADAVPIDLDQDGRPDVAAVERATGKLFLGLNVSAQFRTGGNQVSQVHAPVGTDQPFLALQNTHLGRQNPPVGQSSEAALRPASIALRFRRATGTIFGWQPGLVMTQAEVAAAVESVGFGNWDFAPSTVTGGILNIMPPSAETALHLTPGTTKTYDVSVRIKSSAMNAPITEFFIEHIRLGTGASRWVEISPDGSASQSALTDAADSNPSTLFRLRDLAPVEQWRLGYFGSALSTGLGANDADPDGDGVPNLVEYLLNRDPKGTAEIGGTSPVLSLMAASPSDMLQVDLRLRSAWDPAVELIIQTSSGLNSWATLSSSQGGTDWVGAIPANTTLQGGRTRRIFPSGATPATHPRFFVRLKAGENR